MKIRGNKFMVWNTHINKMSIKPVHLGSLLAEFDDEHKMWQVTYPGLEFREFTRLTDKNGKEIYEGDIVERYGDFRYEVVLAEGAFYLGEYRTPDFLLSDDLVEVIGNIYEHPHLLEGVK